MKNLKKIKSKWYWLRLNYKQILSTSYKVATVGGFLAGACISLPDYIGKNIPIRFLLMLVIFIGIFILTAFFTNRRRENQIWSNSSGKIIACYDDLFKIAETISGQEKYVIIPVNTAFDTIVDDSSDSIDKPLVSRNTLHGKWLSQCQKWKLSIQTINEEIESVLSKQYADLASQCKNKTRGRLKEYPIGTIVPIQGHDEYKKITFLLVALSRFDENNNAHATQMDISEVIKKVVRYCDQHGQGNPVYLPLMGTGMSRTNLQKQQALKLIECSLLICSNNIHENVYIVVYSGDKDQVSIFN